jgi:hypothetical protein
MGLSIARIFWLSGWRRTSRCGRGGMAAWRSIWSAVSVLLKRVDANAPCKAQQVFLCLFGPRLFWTLHSERKAVG